MIPAHRFLRAAGERGFSLYTGVPCSFLGSLIDDAVASTQIRYVPAANEGDAVAIAAGSELGGIRSVCMFQNSGLGNAVSPLSSLTSPFRIPMLILVTHRGDEAGPPDEPQHELMGRITTQVLELLGIPWERFPLSTGEISEVLDRADRWMATQSMPFALIVGRDSLEPGPDATADHEPAGPARRDPSEVPPPLEPFGSRFDVLRAVRDATDSNDVIVATTGFTGRQLYALGDAPNQLYMVGSMGCASSVGLGLAIASPRHRIVVLDGDGAALMRLGALATIGHEQPSNLVHLLLDNGRHESTGGQRTVSDTTDFAQLAAACGYRVVERAASPDQLQATLANRTEGPLFVHVPIHPGTPGSLPRPDVTPAEVAARLRAHIAATAISSEVQPSR